MLNDYDKCWISFANCWKAYNVEQFWSNVEYKSTIVESLRMLKSINILLNSFKLLLKHLVQVLKISWNVESNRRLYKSNREKVYKAGTGYIRYLVNYLSLISKHWILIWYPDRLAGVEYTNLSQFMTKNRYIEKCRMYKHSTANNHVWQQIPKHRLFQDDWKKNGRSQPLKNK